MTLKQQSVSSTVGDNRPSNANQSSSSNRKLEAHCATAHTFNRKAANVMLAAFVALMPATHAPSRTKHTTHQTTHAPIRNACRTHAKVTRPIARARRAGACSVFRYALQSIHAALKPINRPKSE